MAFRKVIRQSVVENITRYFFNIEDHVRDEDDDGHEFVSSAHARAVAVVFAGDFLSDHPELLDDGRAFRVDVRDANRVRVVAISMIAEEGEGAEQAAQS